ncbi:hypothetical protein HDV05_005769 [Chytridiales sp. JEL 0842]|nr:hypothetical protein HDV05_005769 [Chytridiales sp. JEL 0842]
MIRSAVTRSLTGRSRHPPLQCLHATTAQRILRSSPSRLVRRWNQTAALDVASVGPSPTFSTTNTTINQNTPSKSDSSSTPGPEQVYKSKVSKGILIDDEHQRRTVAHLQNLYDTLKTYKPPPVVEIEYHVDDAKASFKVGLEQMDDDANVFGRIYRALTKPRRKEQPKPHFHGPRGLYLHGDVGTGKTMTMDLFFNTLDIQRKRRVHFHAFMLDIHRRVHYLRKDRNITYDPIPHIAQELANDAWLLCFDELQVTDITDAMILRRLFAELFERGVVMVTTSNRPPDDLLKERMIVHSLDSGIDYRMADRKQKQVFFWPLGPGADAKIARVWNELVAGHEVKPETIHFLGRSVTIPESAARCAKVQFKVLCGQPHSAADYIEIVKHYDTIIVTDVPRMSLFQRNEARRFITLIDAIYENKVKFMMTSECQPDDLMIGDEEHPHKEHLAVEHRMLMDDLKLKHEHLESSIFTGAEEQFAFQRAVSRLHEMQGCKNPTTFGVSDQLL